MNQIVFLTTQIVTLKTNRKRNEKKPKKHMSWVILFFVLQLHQGYNLAIKILREMPLIELRCK